LGNGEYSFDITDQTVETITLTIIVDGVEIIDNPGITFTNIVFEESFTDPQSSLPAGWSKEVSTGTTWTTRSTSYAGGTSHELRFSGYTTVSVECRVNTGLIDASQASNLQLKFKHFVNHFVNTYKLSVETQLEGSDTWIESWSINPNSNIGPETIEIDFGALDGEIFKIAWIFEGVGWHIDNWYIDDIVLKQN